MYIYSISYVVLCYHIYSRLSRTAKWIITWMFILLAKINKLQQLHMRRSVFLKVPKCEIFHLFDFNDFYGIKSV
jgi:hypothetical protein